MPESSPSAERRRENVELKSSGSQASGCVTMVIALIWNGITYGILGALYFGGEEFTTFYKVFMGVFIAIGLLLMFSAIIQLLAERKLHPPQVTLSRQPLHLGEKFTGQFSQEAKSHAMVNRITIKLICREQAIYRQGTTTSTVTQDVITKEFALLESEQVDVINGLKGEFHFQIPEEAMHSFLASHNKIEWIIETYTDIEGWPDYQDSFSLQVAPKRAIQQEKV